MGPPNWTGNDCGKREKLEKKERGVITIKKIDGAVYTAMCSVYYAKNR